MNFKNLTLSKEMYEQNKDFCTVLEELDPQYHYIGTKYQNTTAFQRQLIRFNLNSDSLVADFFQNKESAILFPEFVFQNIKKGRDDATLDLFAVTTCIHSYDYKGVHIKEQQIVSNDKLCKMYKTGTSIGNYESICRQQLKVFEICLQQLGRKIAEAETQNLINYLKSEAVCIYDNDITCRANQYLRRGIDTIITDDFNESDSYFKYIYASRINGSIGIRKDASLERVVYYKPEIDYEALINKQLSGSISFIEGYNILDVSTVAKDTED